MIQLREDCLWLKGDDGEIIPCSVEQITLEIIDGVKGKLDPEVLRHAAAAVLHYFKVELARESVTVTEFAEAMSRVLAGFGLAFEVAEVQSSKAGPPDATAPEAEPTTVGELADSEIVVREIQIQSADLRELAQLSGKLGELEFFPRLHDALRKGLEAGPEVVEFSHLRCAVKQLLGRKHWTNGCRELESRIVEALRTWLSEERRRAALLIH
jgi:hypothetical protein